MLTGAVPQSETNSSVSLLDVVSFEEAQRRERELFTNASALPPGHVQILIWRTGKAIIVPRGMPQRHGYAEAVAAMSARGFPVYERDTGGDLTPQMPGMVNLSMVFRLDGDNPNIEASYRRLVQPVVGFLRSRFGLVADVCAVPGAFCDGAYNIAYDGKKLAGTAQRWRLIGGEGSARKAAVLGHIALMADIDLEPAIDALNEFYSVAGIQRHIDLEKHVTLAQLAGGADVRPDVIAAALASFCGGASNQAGD